MSLLKICGFRPLRGLLRGRSTAEVAVDVGVEIELANDGLNGIPDLAGLRGSALVSDSRVDASLELGQTVLDVRALAIASTDESSVDDDQDPGAALEEKRGEEDADPQDQLEPADNGHGKVVVLLNESPNPLGDGVGSILRLALRARRGADLLGRADSGDEVGAGVGSDVEDRVDGVRDEGERVLREEEPDQSHDEVLDVLVAHDNDGVCEVLGAGTSPRPKCLVDDNAIGKGGRDEGGAIRELGHARVVVHSKP